MNREISKYYTQELQFLLQDGKAKTILDVEVLYFPEFERNPIEDRNHGSSLQNQTHAKLKGNMNLLKFIYSEKATEIFKISTLLFSVCTVDKSKVEILQNFMAFSEYTNFTISKA